MIAERKQIQATLPTSTASTVGPSPTVIEMEKDAAARKLGIIGQDNITTNHFPVKDTFFSLYEKGGLQNHLQ